MDINGEIPCLVGKKIYTPTCRRTSAQAGQLSGQECEGTNTSHGEREGVRAGMWCLCKKMEQIADSAQRTSNDTPNSD